MSYIQNNSIDLFPKCSKNLNEIGQDDLSNFPMDISFIILLLKEKTICRVGWSVGIKRNIIWQNKKGIKSIFNIYKKSLCAWKFSECFVLFKMHHFCIHIKLFTNNANIVIYKACLWFIKSCLPVIYFTRYFMVNTALANLERVRNL